MVHFTTVRNTSRPKTLIQAFRTPIVPDALELLVLAYKFATTRYSRKVVIAYGAA